MKASSPKCYPHHWLGEMREKKKRETDSHILGCKKSVGPYQFLIGCADLLGQGSLLDHQPIRFGLFDDWIRTREVSTGRHEL